MKTENGNLENLSTGQNISYNDLVEGIFIMFDV